jgi:hypothetical protein
MNKQIRSELARLRGSVDRLDAALNQKKVPDVAFRSVMKQLTEMTAFVNSFGTGFTHDNTTVSSDTLIPISGCPLEKAAALRSQSR